MKIFLAFVLAATCHAQMPPVPPLTKYLAVAAVEGTNYSAWSNEISVPIGQYSLAFNPSATLGVTYILGSGHISGHYTTTNQLGTNTTTLWPIQRPQPPTVLVASCGGVPFLTVTNPTGFHLYKSLPTGTSNLWSIADTTDLRAGWTNPFTYVKSLNGGVTIARQP